MTVITGKAREHVMSRIHGAQTRADLEHFWNNCIGIPLKSDPDFIAAFYSCLKSFIQAKK